MWIEATGITKGLCYEREAPPAYPLSRQAPADARLHSSSDRPVELDWLCNDTVHLLLLDSVIQ